jgi:glycosyltransferase involved in cell wall biosynthesis
MPGDSSMYLGVNGIRLVAPISGVARYIENVLRCWSNTELPFAETRVYTPRPLPPHVVLPPKVRSVVAPTKAPLAVWEQFHLPRLHGPRAVLFCPSYVAPLWTKCPVVVVHHGSYEAYPQAFSWWRRQKAYVAYRYSARRADRLITVSEHSKRDMVRFYGIPAARIHVIPEGVDTSCFRPIDDQELLAGFRRRMFGEDVPFILYVGKPVRRRNVPALLEAYARLVRERRLPHRFVCIGSDLPGMRLAPLIKQLGLEQRVTLIGHAPHDFIAQAYNSCSLFVYPSSYEGFGMPVLEAMACGTPTITLGNTSFMEFADGAAFLAQRGDATTLFQAMEEVLDNPTWKDRMRQVGVPRAQNYDWNLIAERTMKLIVELI